MSQENLKKLINRKLESEFLRDFYSSLNENDAKKLVIQNKKYNLHEQPAKILENELLNIDKISNGLINEYKNIVIDLLSKLETFQKHTGCEIDGIDSEFSNKIIKRIVDIDSEYNIAINGSLNIIKAISDYSFKSSKVMPTVDRHFKGKTQKAKKTGRLKAEEWAKDIWGKDPTITQENMAYQLKDKLDLTQTIQTIIRWIKPFQPPK